MDEQQPVPLTKSAPAQSAPAAPAPVAEAELRASDADRDRIADILREALAEGRLQPEEHAERIDAVYRAKTIGELEPLVRDLPAAPVHGAASAPGRDAGEGWSRSLPEGENLVAIFGGSTRKGRWRVRRRTNALAIFGGVEIDLTEAVFEQREIVIHVVAAFGGVEIKVPENVSLRGSGAGILGGFDVRTYEAQDPEAPVIHVTGFAVFGGVEAKPKRGKRLKNLRT
ncbi:DUF1707 domain-containing protein [Streptomyces sp. SID8361]|uniref:DUF1707 SHOCT-like domain-containing protein n=1 Tax=Streptomyces TaxID=1883 RepID=UPI0009A16824|nr:MULTISPECIES: DUF1707 domain-containing protein [Streptomyces]MYU16663.1 DUF1707 domain-containing protein [Streptomyces sp. SID8361]MYX62633.1 DUF1707 domain-containing protein [Streptomyces sp. SID8382]QDL71042.1 DUF1707 and DUF2154 domain-containing protein [Streptomyces malaysiensis]